MAPRPSSRRISYLPILLISAMRRSEEGAGRPSDADRKCANAGGAPASRSRATALRHLYLLSISHTFFWISRWTMVSSETPPCCDCEMPITDVDVAPTSIFSSV